MIATLEITHNLPRGELKKKMGLELKVKKLNTFPPSPKARLALVR